MHPALEAKPRAALPHVHPRYGLGNRCRSPEGCFGKTVVLGHLWAARKVEFQEGTDDVEGQHRSLSQILPA